MREKACHRWAMPFGLAGLLLTAWIGLTQHMRRKYDERGLND